MTDSIIVELAGAPMAKERVRVTKTGHAYTPERTVNYEARLAHAAQIVMNGRPLLDGPLEVLVETYMPVPESKPKKWKDAALSGQIRPTKKPDWDNFGKILDSMNLIVWADDAQIVDGRVVKWYSARPRMVVVVRPVKQNEGAFS
ncbi:RusA family crossover junction endodeoxyribonuclease [Mesorhizobium sp. ESP7-2]|uniref:RusA family crossover junction endodeoxyribonuclease n=1 Tax=Mesorhizobium sp. ESP7-2 TaxID=2876622 RepID=UPI001CCA8C98|nr:RusA family crossover junction endodeoxyribonuclease [Mesorhizobium sp. ESP7-2]MBZ9706116.1 RusA family crossover junction endodeoxyribonuclease [Mesorhizobium sp. ESP7-2]